MNKIILAISLSAIAIIGALLFVGRQNPSPTTKAVASKDNVSVVDGQQIIKLTAKGGYSPQVTQASANLPTILRVKTQGTFDCSSAITIPSLNYRKNLPPSGETDIELANQKPGDTLQGLCAMGMYNFQIQFQ